MADEFKNDWQIEDKNEQNEGQTRAEVVEEIIAKVSRELKLAHREKYEMEKAERTAALCLTAQIELAEFLAEAELLAKEKKSEVESVSSERYYFYKSEAETKITDVGLNRLVDKDELVKAAKKEQFSAEADYNKWKSLMGTLRDSHIYFRGISKSKNDF